MRILVVGAGMMGRAVAYDLVRQDDVAEVGITDTDASRLREIGRFLRSPKVRTFRGDAADSGAMRRLMERFCVAVSCVPYYHNLGLTKAAITARIHFCDLGGSNTVVARQRALDSRARRAGVTVIPDCGLAPGLVSVFAADGFARLDRTDAIHIRVGGLPRKPRPPLNYGLVFSAAGLINEYVEPCLVLRRGRLEHVPPLASLEEIRFPRPWGTLEAFNTSGGSSTLPLTFRGSVRTLDYKTIRYPGHCAQIRLLLELGLTDERPTMVTGQSVVPRELLIERLERVLPREKDDVVLLRVTASGTAGRRRREVRYRLIDYARPKSGLTAMMRTTGFPAAVVALMLGRGAIHRPGVTTSESAVPTRPFIAELRRRGVPIVVATRRGRSRARQ